MCGRRWSCSIRTRYRTSDDTEMISGVESAFLDGILIVIPSERRGESHCRRDFVLPEITLGVGGERIVVHRKRPES